MSHEDANYDYLFPFGMEHEINFTKEMKASIDNSKCLPHPPAFDLAQLFEEDDLKSNRTQRKPDRIITGLHAPSVPLNMGWTETTKTIITQTKIITKTKTKIVSDSKQEEPPFKKQKTSSDWRSGHNQPIDPSNAIRKLKPKRKSNSTGVNIPLGLEHLFDEQTGNLVEELADLDPKLVETIGYELLNRTDNISWDDIAGLEPQKKRIQEVVIWPLLKPDLFHSDSLLEPAKGALLFGPPGTGKTMIAKAIAAESSANFFSISPSSLQSKWVGESSKLVKTMFSVARYMAPSIVFMDEVDSLLGKRSNGSGTIGNSMNTLKTQFLMEFQGAKSSKNDGFVLIVGATNFPEVIDDAARRRFSRRLYIPLPDEKGRAQLLRKLLEKSKQTMGHCMTEKDIECIVKKTKGYSGSDITDLAKEAALGPLREAAKIDTVESVTKDKLRPLRLDDFEEALKQNSATVTDEQVLKYEAWNDKFGVKQ